MLSAVSRIGGCGRIAACERTGHVRNVAVVTTATDVEETSVPRARRHRDLEKDHGLDTTLDLAVLGHLPGCRHDPRRGDCCVFEIQAEQCRAVRRCTDVADGRNDWVIAQGDVDAVGLLRDRAYGRGQSHAHTNQIRER
jgi:hypothetical protein